MMRSQLTAVDIAWREQATRKPVLLVHEKMSTRDRQAVELVRSELGEAVKIVGRKNGDGEELPCLLASASVYRGLEDITAFVSAIAEAKSEPR